MAETGLGSGDNDEDNFIKFVILLFCQQKNHVTDKSIILSKRLNEQASKQTTDARVSPCSFGSFFYSTTATTTSSPLLCQDLIWDGVLVVGVLKGSGDMVAVVVVFLLTQTLLLDFRGNETRL